MGGHEVAVGGLGLVEKMVLYVVHRLGGASLEEINAAVAYAVLVDGGEFRPVEDRALLKSLVITGAGWIIRGVKKRLRLLSSLGLVALEGRYVRPRAAVEGLEADLAGVLDRLNGALEVLRAGGVGRLVEALDELTGTAIAKYSFVGWSAARYMKALRVLDEIAKEYGDRFASVPTSHEFEKLRRRIKEPSIS
ncbi:hypothetical protein [Pyrobaculum neutrophilum]|uniref:Uncharacterized protein n=1 Tax=Pyrobaculum neutrophilum (strain DSM 2338 / JCM 9278 / NBRC 100436 / V24Sta) TaxID=444157 RepID=B1YCC7_PYRNV|nr:hypothetical protein [Pyrobaculum neutrophilum]ACB39440.1 conserved hypothetical protein [Pyrobaculum neutrophilum V24Sta]